MRSDLAKVDGVSDIKTDIKKQSCQFKLANNDLDLKAKLEELQKQLDAIEADEEEKQPPAKGAKDKHQKARELLKKGATDLEKWKIGLKVTVGQMHKMCGEASSEVEKHGSGKVKIEPYFKYDF